MKRVLLTTMGVAFGEKDVYWGYVGDRSLGFPVRAVRAK